MLLIRQVVPLFDGAILWFCGCPMAKDDLTGNMLPKNAFFIYCKQKQRLI
jgi:hypothetical protein